MVIDNRSKYPEIEKIKKKLRKEQERADQLANRSMNNEKHSNTKRHKHVDLGNGFYQSKEWRELRWKAIKKSNGKCVYCGRSHTQHGIVIHVDHIKPRSKYPHLALELNNLQITCEDCNTGKGTKEA